MSDGFRIVRDPALTEDERRAVERRLEGMEPGSTDWIYAMVDAAAGLGGELWDGDRMLVLAEDGLDEVDPDAPDEPEEPLPNGWPVRFEELRLEVYGGYDDLVEFTEDHWARFRAAHPQLKPIEAELGQAVCGVLLGEPVTVTWSGDEAWTGPISASAARGLVRWASREVGGRAHSPRWRIICGDPRGAAYAWLEHAGEFRRGGPRTIWTALRRDAEADLRQRQELYSQQAVDDARGAYQRPWWKKLLGL